MNKSHLEASQDYNKSYSLAEYSISKLESKLSLQKNSSTLNLSDSFIGDSGCSLLSSYIRENLNLHKVELRGNSISEEGIRILAAAFRQQHFIRNISLEWNNIGNSVGILLESLAHCTSIQLLDLRNNKIGAEGASAIASFLETNTSISKIDLRWNEIGTLGCQRILQALPRCPSLKFLEVSGNKISEEILIQLENQLALRNGANDYAEDSRMILSKAEDTVRSEEFELSARRSPTRSHYTYNDELYNKFEAQMINNARNEAKINELEILLQQETRKTQDLKNDFYKELESEKARRAYSDQALMLFKEESLKRDMNNQRLIQELENKLNCSEKEYSELRLEYENLQVIYENATSENQARLRNLEEKLSCQERQSRQSEENFRSLVDRLKKDHEQAQFDLTRDFQAKLESSNEVQNSLKLDKESQESENRSLRAQISHIKHQAQLNLEDLECRLREEATEKFNFAERNYEIRIQNLEESRESCNKRLQEVQKDLNFTENKANEQISALESTLSQLKAEKSDLTQRLQKVSSQKDSIQSELQSTRSLLERTQSENSDLTKVLKERKESYSAQVEKMTTDYNSERKLLENAKDSLNEQLRQLEIEVIKVKRERDRALKEFEYLNDNLKQKVNSMIQDTVLGHMRKVEEITR